MKINFSFYILIPLLFTLLFTACQGSGSEGAKVPFEVIHSGSYSAITEKRELIINSDADYQKLMIEVYKNLDQMPRIPVVDFKKNSLVAVFMAQKTSGGYMINIDSITESSVGLTVNVTESSPGKGCTVTDALTQPYEIVKIPKTEEKTVFKFKQIVKDCQ